jgi:deoxycytidylate deaminase
MDKMVIRAKCLVGKAKCLVGLHGFNRMVKSYTEYVFIAGCGRCGKKAVVHMGIQTVIGHTPALEAEMDQMYNTIVKSN